MGNWSHKDCIGEAEQYCAIRREMDAAVSACKASQPEASAEEFFERYLPGSLINSQRTRQSADAVFDSRSGQGAGELSKALTAWGSALARSTGEAAVDAAMNSIKRGFYDSLDRMSATRAEALARPMTDQDWLHRMQAANDTWSRDLQSRYSHDGRHKLDWSSEDTAPSDPPSSVSLQEIQNMLNDAKAGLEADRAEQTAALNQAFDDTLNGTTNLSLEERMQELLGELPSTAPRPPRQVTSRAERSPGKLQSCIQSCYLPYKNSCPNGGGISVPNGSRCSQYGGVLHARLIACNRECYLAFDP